MAAPDAEEVILRMQNQLSGPALEAVASLGTLERQIASGGDALRSMEAQMRVLQSATVVDIDAFRQLSAAIDAQKGSLGDTQQAYVAMGGSAEQALGAAKKGVAGLIAEQDKLAASAQAAADKVAAAAEKQAASAQAAADRSAQEQQRHANRLAEIAAEATANDIAQRNAALAELISQQSAANIQSEQEAKQHENKLAQIAAEGSKKVQEAQAPVSKSVTAVGGASNGAKLDVEALAGALPILGGSMGGVAAQGVNLVKFFSKLGPEVAIAIVAVLAFAAALLVVVAAASKALTASSAARDEWLRMQGQLELTGREAGKLAEVVSFVSANSALGKDKISGYADALSKAGLAGGELQRALEAASVAGSAGSDAVASKFLAQVQATKAAGGSVDALSAKMQKQLGGVAAKQLLSLSVQTKKLGESVDELFSGAELESFLGGLQNMLSLFSQSSSIGQEMKVVLGQAMTGFFDAASKALPYIKEGIVGILIVAVSMYIAFKKVANAINELLPAGDGIRDVSAALELGKVAGYALVVVFGALALAATVLAAAVIIGALPFIAIGYAIYLVVDTVSQLIDAWDAAGAALGELDFGTIATGIIDGMVNGIKAGAARVLSTITDLGKGAVAAMKSAIGMASPAKAFVNVGDMGIDEGVVVGVEKGAGRVDDSVSEVVYPETAAPGLSAAGVKLAAKGGGSGGARIAYFEIHTTDADIPEKIRVALREQFEIEELDAESAAA